MEIERAHTSVHSISKDHPLYYLSCVLVWLMNCEAPTKYVREKGKEGYDQASNEPAFWSLRNSDGDDAKYQILMSVSDGVAQSIFKAFGSSQG